MTASVLNIILVSFILIGMVMVIAGIRHIFAEEDPKQSADSLRREVKEEDEVISSHSVFREFLTPARDSGERGE